MTKSLNIKTSQKIVPMCYAYTTPQISDHDGYNLTDKFERGKAGII